VTLRPRLSTGFALNQTVALFMTNALYGIGGPTAQGGFCYFALGTLLVLHFGHGLRISALHPPARQESYFDGEYQ